MNETINVIKNRRSYRKFESQQIKDSEIQTIMECAILAPNARNQQKWHFSVIQNKDFLLKVANITKENLINSGIEFLANRAKEPGFSPYYDAPTVVFVTADEKTRFADIDSALAAQNILIAAEALNIGSHIMTSTEFLFASDKGKAIKKEMGIPDSYVHVCAIALGYKGKDTLPDRSRDKNVITYIN